MPISHEAAVARAKKAAATRARNRAARGEAPAFPNSYHARPTQHVTRDLRLKQTPKQIKHPLAFPKSKKAVRAMSTADLQRQYEYWGNIPGKDMPKRRNADTIFYAIKEELRYRANPNFTLAMHREGIRDIGGHRIKGHAPGKPRKTKRASAKVARHRK